MLSSLLKDHNSRQSARKEHCEHLRQAAAKSASDLTSALVDHLNVGVAQAYLNQKRLDAEAKQLHTNAAEFAKQTAAWSNLVTSFTSGALRELGDVESWAKSIESDMTLISSTLEYSYKVNHSP